MSAVSGTVPKSEQETCRVYCRGQIFEGWTSFALNRSYGNAVSLCTLEITEPQQSGDKAKWVDWQIKPGDPITVKLGGVQAFKGYVFERQAAYSADQHGVRITAGSDTQDAVAGSVIPDAGGGRYAGYTIDQIARSVLKPFGIPLKTLGDMGAAFPVVQVMHGETAFELIERLARMRGIGIHDDESGAMVLNKGNTGKTMPALIEGLNILAANGTLGWQDYSSVQVSSQLPGDDRHFGKDASQVSATVQNPKVKRYRPQLIMSEHPVDEDGAKARAHYELSKTLADTVRVTATVQGWFASPGALWEIKGNVKVTSPMLLLDQALIIYSVEFRQSSSEGTTTELELVTDAALVNDEQFRPDDSGGWN